MSITDKRTKMNIKQITENIYYVGVNDRTTVHFEGLWDLPKGVSYNSYIVRGGDSTALIDTVAIGEFGEFLANVQSVTDSIDYLIVNHMEPDHSGSIPGIMARYPNLKIVADKIAIGMIKGFYGIADDSKFYEVKDGDTLDLGGGQVLSFHTTPMVHWPETMMTYLASEQMLFSGDAFGTFGALNGAVIDEDCDIEFYASEMRRYYASIVGKYSPFVQKALAKLSGFPLRYICSTHGPVWHSNISEIVKAYDCMSRQECEEGVVIVYGSMYGNTAKMVDSLASSLKRAGIPHVRVFNAGETGLSFILSEVWRYKGLIVASPTYSMDLFPPIEAFMKAIEIRELKNHVAAALGSFAWAPGVASKKIQERFEALGLPVIGRCDMRMSPDDSIAKALDSLAKEMASAIKPA